MKTFFWEEHKDIFKLEEPNYLNKGYNKFLKSIIGREPVVKTNKTNSNKCASHRISTSDDNEISTYLEIAMNNINSTLEEPTAPNCKKCNGTGWYLKVTLGNYFAKYECDCKEEK